MLLYIAGGGAACAVGVLISLFNFGVSKKILQTDPDRYAFSTAIRQLLNIGWLFICFLIGEKTGLPTAALLVGAVLGVTLPSFFFIPHLLRVNREAGAKTSEREEGNADG